MFPILGLPERQAFSSWMATVRQPETFAFVWMTVETSPRMWSTRIILMVNAPQKWHLEVQHTESGMDKNTLEAINLQGEVVALEPQDAINVWIS